MPTELEKLKKELYELEKEKAELKKLRQAKIELLKTKLEMLPSRFASEHPVVYSLIAEIEEYTKKINKINSMIAKIKARINILEE